MKKIVLEIIEKLSKEKEQAKVFPTHVLDIEIKEEFRKQYNDAIFKLAKEKKIKFSKTVNHNCIKLLSFSPPRENDQT